MAVFVMATGPSLMCQDSTYTDDNHYTISATPANTFRLNAAVGLSLAILPQPLTEYPTPAPMVDVRFKIGLPFGFGGYGRVASNIATSILQGGGMYGATLGSLAIAGGYSAAYVYGNITYVDGFNTTQQRWINYPMIAATWLFPKASMTVRIEAEITNSVVSEIENQPTGGDRNAFTGGSITIAFEQPFFANQHLLLGATLQLSSDPYQAWFLYNQFDDQLFSSEFFIGFIL